MQSDTMTETTEVRWPKDGTPVGLRVRWRSTLPGVLVVEHRPGYGVRFSPEEARWLAGQLRSTGSAWLTARQRPRLRREDCNVLADLLEEALDWLESRG